MLSLTNIAFSFLAGFLTFFAGCLAPIVPVYISFLAGSAGENLQNPTRKTRSKVFINSIFFVSGFIGIFALLGFTVNSLAKFLTPYQHTLRHLGGFILILFGIHMTGLLKINFIYRERKFSVQGLKNASKASSFALGGIFGFSWTPCIGPVLAAILFWAGSQETIVQALVLMLSFSAGLAIPFLAIGFFFDKLMGKIKQLNQYGPKLQLASGIILIIFGVLLLTDQFTLLSSFFLKLFGSAAFVVELQIL